MKNVQNGGAFLDSFFKASCYMLEIFKIIWNCIIYREINSKDVESD